MLRKLIRIGLLLCFTPMVILVDLTLLVGRGFHKVFDFIDDTESRYTDTEWITPAVIDKVKSIWAEK